jgi:hypothetical protein
MKWNGGLEPVSILNFQPPPPTPDPGCFEAIGWKPSGNAGFLLSIWELGVAELGFASIPDAQTY